MTTRGPLIALAPMLGKPETVHAREATQAQLYDALDAWMSHRARYGRGQTIEASHARDVANTEIDRIKRELRRRGLPTDRYEWEQTTEDKGEQL